MIEYYSDDLKKALKKWGSYIKKHDKNQSPFFAKKKKKWRKVVFELWDAERPDLKMKEDVRVAEQVDATDLKSVSIN